MNKDSHTSIPQPVLSRARDIKLVLLDVDGVLTDGSLLFTHDGHESKSFNTQDGFGIRLLQESGIQTGVITARKSAAVSKRCENLKMTYVYQGESDKSKAYRDILVNSGFKPFEICYIGDDWLDLVLLKRVGLAVAPANGVDEVKALAHYTCQKSGGDGAVREVCDLILRAKGILETLFQAYMNR